MPYVKGGRFEEMLTTEDPMKRQVSYVWQGDNPPFLNDFHLFEDHDGTFAVACTLRRDLENNLKSQTYQMSVETKVKTKSGIEIDLEDDKGEDGTALTMLTMSTNSYETFKEIFQMMKQCLPPSDPQPEEREQRGRDRDRMQVDKKNRERDRSPPAPMPTLKQGYLAPQNDQVKTIKDIIDNISSELAAVDVEKTIEKLGDMKLK